MYDLELSERAEDIFRLLYTEEFDADALKKELAKGGYTPDDIGSAAYAYIFACNWNEGYPVDREWKKGETERSAESGHITETIGVLLQFGLNPNYLCDETSIMEELQYIHNGYEAADSLALLLEHGGDPFISADDERLIDEVCFDVIFDMIEQENRVRYDCLVHYWMVIIGYEAEHEKFDIPIKPVGGFDLRFLKTHRDYYYGAMSSDEYERELDILIFEKKSNLLVARY